MVKNKNNDDNLLSLKDTIILNPIEKYKYYGRFPWKLIIHLLLLIGTSAQAMLILGNTTKYTRAQERIFYDNFLDEVDKSTLEFSRYAYFFTIGDLKDSISKSISNFYSFKENSFETVEYENDNPQIKLEFEYLSIDQNTQPQFLYFLNQTYSGPFSMSDDDLKTLMQKVLRFKVSYTILTYIPIDNTDYHDCYNWRIIQNFSFNQRAHFQLNLDINRNSCNDYHEYNSNTSYMIVFINKLLWIHIIVIVLSILSFLLTWKYIYKMAKTYWKIKNKLKTVPAQEEDEENLNLNNENQYDNNPNNQRFKSKWDQLNNNDKRILFNKWSIICILGNIVQIFGTGLNLINHSETTNTSEALIGFGCMLAYINIGRYLDYNKDYSTIYATISRALPNVLRYLLGVLPIFFGFIFFGLCLFWRSERFVSTSSTMMTLFAVLNGDSVFDVFNDVANVSFILGQIYCYTFCIIFIVVVMNVFISIIEEAYVSSKTKDKNHWIYSYLKVDPEYIEINADKPKEGKEGNNLKLEKEINIIEDEKKAKLIKQIEEENTMRALLNSKHENLFNENIHQNDEVEETIKKTFSDCLRLMDEVEKMVKEVKKLKNESSVYEFNRMINENTQLLIEKIELIKKLWSYE